MRRFRPVAIGIVLLSAAAWVASAGRSPSPYDPRPDDPYTVSATVASAEGNSFTVHVSVLEKKTGAVVSSPRINLQPGTTAEVFSDRVEGKPEFHTRVSVDNTGKASVTFEAYERVLQRSAVSANATR